MWTNVNTYFVTYVVTMYLRYQYQIKNQILSKNLIVIFNKILVK